MQMGTADCRFVWSHLVQVYLVLQEKQNKTKPLVVFSRVCFRITSSSPLPVLEWEIWQVGTSEWSINSATLIRFKTRQACFVLLAS